MFLEVSFQLFDNSFHGVELYYTKISVVNWNILNMARYIIGKPLMFKAELGKSDYHWDISTPEVFQGDVGFSCRTEKILCACHESSHFLEVVGTNKFDEVDLIIPVKPLSLSRRIWILFGHLFLDNFDPYSDFVGFIVTKPQIEKFKYQIIRGYA